MISSRFIVSSGLALAGALGLSLHSGVAAAQTVDSVDAEEDAGVQPYEAIDKSARLEPRPGLSFGLGAYGGFAVQTTRDNTRSHGVVGGLARLRLSYFELGAMLELSDTAQDRWRSLGGFAGAWLPFRNWVDLEFTVGAVSRRYLSPELRYGPGGYDVGLPALTFRAGLSDRTSEGVLGARLGCDLIASFDLDRKSVPWSYVVEGEEGNRVFSGRSKLGGFAWGLALTASFDVGIKPSSLAPRREASRPRPALSW